jgi:EpsI family protein
MSRLKRPIQVPTKVPATTAHAVRPVLTAAVVAGVALLGTGLGYRALAGHLNRAPRNPSVSPGTLAQLPLRIGDWVGTDTPLDDAVIEAAAVDDYVSRHYVRLTDNRSVGLWVALGGRARDLMPHRPEVCYPGAGWTLRDRDTLALQLEDDQTLRARLLTFVPGGFDVRPQVVLDYYVVDGETCEDVSLLRSKASRGQTAIRYVAQVQITCRREPAQAAATPAETVREVAAESFVPIRNLLEQAVRGAGPRPPGKP